jgi:polyhydroxyalkanoate synthesis regulator phasin
MLDLFKNGVFAGLGAAVITRDKIEEKLKRLVDEGKITSEEARRMADELLESGRGQWDEVKSRIAEKLTSGIEPLGLAKRDEVDSLKRRVVELEERGKAESIRVKTLEERVSALEEKADKGAEKS